MNRLLVLLLCLLSLQCTVPPRDGGFQAPQPPSTIVLLHGLYGQPSNFDSLRNDLAEAGFRTFSPALRPNDGSVSIAVLSDELRRTLRETLPAGTPVQFVGHSMGGLVALRYLQNPDPAFPFRALHTLATPHQGTIVANLHPGAAGREMVPGSDFLTNLNAAPPAVPVFTYRSTNDLAVIPNRSSTLDWAVSNQQFQAPSHDGLLRTPELSAALLENIRSREP